MLIPPTHCPPCRRCCLYCRDPFTWRLSSDGVELSSTTTTTHWWQRSHQDTEASQAQEAEVCQNANSNSDQSHSQRIKECCTCCGQFLRGGGHLGTQARELRSIVATLSSLSVVWCPLQSLGFIHCYHFIAWWPLCGCEIITVLACYYNINLLIIPLPHHMKY